MNILDNRFEYIPAVKTNILARFRAMGWKPPSEAKPKARTPEQRLQQLLRDLDRISTFTKDGKTARIDAAAYERAIARAEGF